MILGHLRREYAISLFAGEKGSKFICFDVDDDNKETAARVIDELSTLGIPRGQVYVSFSGRAGYHAEVFFDEIIETEHLMNLYEHVIRNGGLDYRKVKFCPTERRGIRLPLSIHEETGNICWYVDPSTMQPIEDEGYIASIAQVHVDDIKDALFPVPADAADENVKSGSEDDAAPSAILTNPRMRFKAMSKNAAWNRLNGISREENRNALEEWCSVQPSEMIESFSKDIAQDITNILNWVYSDRFSMKYAGRMDSAMVSEGQLEILLNLPSRSTRRVCFLLLVRTRMNAPRISAANISNATGVCVKTVYDALRQLSSLGVVSVRGRGRYVVPHKASWPNETRLEISTRELNLDFDRSYHRALYRLIHPDRLKDAITPEEWQEYLDWAQVFESEGDELPDDRRIDMVGRPFDLAMPFETTCPITAYYLEDRWLFPAYNMASLFGLNNPSQCGIQSPHKETWRIQVNRRVQPNGTIYQQVLNLNFIPLEDVLKLLDRSAIPQKEEVRAYLMSLDERKPNAVGEGKRVS